MNKHSKIYVAGHTGLVGSAIVRTLVSLDYSNIIVRDSKQLDLRNQSAVSEFFNVEKPEYVFLAAAKVGGILANSTLPAEFIYDNLTIQTNIIHSAYKYNVKKLLFLGSSCIYPKHCPQPIKEEYLLSGYLESTNEPYAVAKIAGIKMCQAYNAQYGTNFICAMLTNLYGPHDNFDIDTSHVIPGLINKIHSAKLSNSPEVTVWGTGMPRREFLYVDDAADACVFLMNNYNSAEIINVGSGQDISITELVYLIEDIVRYSGKILFDSSFPDGTLQKLLDITKLVKLGWTLSTSLQHGIKLTYNSYINILNTENA